MSAPDPASVYYFTPNYDLFNCLQADDDQARLLRNLDCREAGAEWPPLKLRLERSRRKTASDFPAPHTNVPALTPRAWAALEPLVGHCVEPLPVTAGKAEFVLLRVRGTCPAFDEAKSRGVMRDEYRGLYWVTEFAFRPDVPFADDLFRVAPGVDRLFVTERFRAVVEAHGLTGLLWTPVRVATGPGKSK